MARQGLIQDTQAGFRRQETRQHEMTRLTRTGNKSKAAITR